MRNAPVINVKPGQITKTNTLSARQSAEVWWEKNVGKPIYIDTEIGLVEIDKNTIKDSLSHGYNQGKLDAITTLPNGFDNAVYIGSMEDFKRPGVVNHYFAYPIKYNEDRCYVFCRAMADNNKNRLYIHEMFMEGVIKESDTLQTIASASLDGELHGGIAFYKAVLKNVLDATNIPQSSESASEGDENLYREGNNTKATPARARVHINERIHELCDRLHLDNVEVMTDTTLLEGKQAKARGFYSKRTGKITVVLPNHISVADAEQTPLHEAVAHHGLRQLFDEHFDAFLEKVYTNASEDVRRRIATLASKNGWDFNKATEEYLATLAEDTDFENFNRGWFHKIKELFIGMLEKLGFKNLKNTTFSDNELRYILWRSYKNLSTPLSSNAPLVVAEDIAMQYGLGVGNYSPQSSAGDVLFREGNEVSPEAPSGIAVRDDYRMAHQYLEFILENCDFDQLIWERDEAGNRWIHVSCRGIGNRGKYIRL